VISDVEKERGLRVLRKVLGPKEVELTGDWRKLRKHELIDFYC
jgi:hypothetical protein